MKVLLSAYACEPGKGSEPEVGLRTAIAAAERHDVWVVTRQNNVQPLEDYLTDHPLRDRIELVGFDIPGRLLRWKKRSRLADQLYYDRWQRGIGDLARDLDSRIGFDLVHHITFAAYWKRSGVASLDLPFVWGPVGGGTRVPLRMYGELGALGTLEELARRVVRPLVARSPGIRLAQRSADVVLAQNWETAALIHSKHDIDVVPNALSIQVPTEVVPELRSGMLLSVGQLIPLKAVGLAIRAFARAEGEPKQFVVVGDGPERQRLERLVADLGIEERVVFTGRLPRQEVLTLLAGAQALVHTSLHEEAGLVVAEALSYGTPVVCIDQGGPPVLLGEFAAVRSEAVPLSTPERTVTGLSRAIRDTSRVEAPTGIQTPERSFSAVLFDAYDKAMDRHRQFQAGEHR